MIEEKKTEEKEVVEKNKWWRPSKLKDFLKAFQEVLKLNESDVVYLTDDELRICCNNLLEDEHQISSTTFENWKAWKLKDSPEYQGFLVLYKNALINQKRELFKAVNKWEANWQSRAWIIERKFSEWNLKIISEVDQTIKWDLNINDYKNLSTEELLALKWK